MFGFVAGGSSLRKGFLVFAELLGKRLRRELALFEAASYDELKTALSSGYVDLAWLPPIPFIALEQRRVVVPLVRIRRGASDTFRSALVVRADSPIHAPADLAGKRAAWVDAESASGFVIPRIALDELGVDVRHGFARQRFFHSHESVARAVAAGLSDFGATYAGVSQDGRVARGPWLDTTGDFRVLSIFGEIPGDVLAARSGWTRRDELVAALLEVAADRRMGAAARGPFGADELRAFDEVDGAYDGLRRALAAAAKRGVLDVVHDSCAVTRGET